jgi:[NiFe] hydrogenase diaphorase moiety large subunit
LHADARRLLDEMKLSNLRGRGGAGFTTHTKWESARRAPCRDLQGSRYVVCNADEGEPGTFKDRVLLASHADLVFDGMSVAAFAIGAEKGCSTCAASMPGCCRRCTRIWRSGGRTACLAWRLRPAGTGRSTSTSTSALAPTSAARRRLCSSRSKAAVAYPGFARPIRRQQGYRGQPTVVNNVETLCKAALIALRGGAWFAGLGSKQSTGTKLLSIAGDVESPGVYEYPFGVSWQPGARRLWCRQCAGGAGQRSIG